jgi:hypothetical protein
MFWWTSSDSKFSHIAVSAPDGNHGQVFVHARRWHHVLGFALLLRLADPVSEIAELQATVPPI